MKLDELTRQGQAQPGALDFSHRRPALAELLEHSLLIFWRDSDSGVAHVRGWPEA